MRKKEKIELAEELRTMMAEAKVVLLTDFRGLTVEELTDLRKQARAGSIRFRVAKNRLLAKAMEGTEMEGLGEFLTGPTAVAIHSDDPVSPAKLLVEFAKEHEALTMKGGLVEGTIIDAAAIKALSRLPGLEELRAGILGSANALLGTVTSAVDALFQEMAGLVEAREKALGEAKTEAA